MGHHDADITVLLHRAAAGEIEAEAELFEAIYGQLRVIARATMAGERPDHSLQPTALVHEAFLKLRGASISFEDRNHFFATAARAMRRVLVDHARARLAIKRPESGHRVEVDERLSLSEDDPVTILAVDEVLGRLHRLDKRQAAVVEMRFFGGLTEEEIGQALGVSSRTVKREWRFARLWLFAQLSDKARAGGTGP